MYIPRALERVLDDHADAPVTIVEGARASGKTTLVRALVDRGRYRSYATLADPTVLSAARSDPWGWLASLQRPAVVDEAQVVDVLPLAVKEAVDRLGPGEHYVLTGSASIGRSGLGGADPLVRRAVRHTLSPFTQSELAGDEGSLVDLLFDADMIPGRIDRRDHDIARVIRYGGFPAYALSSARLSASGLSSRVRADVDSTLGDTVLPDDRFDGARAHAVLDALLRAPGGILNTSRLGDILGLDRRTIDRYLDVLERRFLIRHLPNLAVAGRQAPRSRSKIHAVDTSIAADALLRSGRDLAQDRGVLGGLLETHVVNQVLAARSWASTSTRPTYWRQASRGDAEVDLVLTDGVGRLVAIEVKAAGSVGPRDLSGIRALASERPVHRAFIVYTGGEVVQLADNTWALPAESLGRTEHFSTRSSSQHAGARRPRHRSDEPGADVPDDSPTMFVSYSRADDTYLGGAMSSFARAVAASYEFLYGESLRLFLDQDDLAWGDDWARRLHDEIEKTAFLLAMVTPGYLRSEACRREFQQFDTAARTAGDRRLLLPLMWTEPESLSGTDDQDPVLQTIRARQYDTSGTEIRSLEPGSLAFRQMAERLARRLRDVVVAREAATPVPAEVTPGDDTKDDRDLSELIDDVEDLLPGLQHDAEALGSALESVGAAFAAMGPVAGGARLTSEQFGELAERLADPVLRLDGSSSSLGERWGRIDQALGAVALLAVEFGDDVVRADLVRSLRGLLDGLGGAELDQMRQVAGALAAVSRHLRPTARAMVGALTVLDGVRSSVASWIEVLDTDR